MKSPILIREARVWLKCQEIRKPVAAGMAYRVAYLASCVPTAIVAAPFAAVSIAAYGIHVAAQTVAVTACRPSVWLHVRRQECIKQAHATMPPHEIRERMGKKSPKIIRMVPRND